MKKVVVGLSGGIDSSVAAFLLVRAGYEVIGVTLQIWEKGEYEEGPWHERSCCKIGLARFVADQLKIPYHIYDVHREFQKIVVEEFCREYMRGRTPNPCITCNEKIKFALLMEKAKELGADFIATGHYARIEMDRSGRYLLKKGIDPDKDQSYFLYRLSRDMLPRIIFPLGTYVKRDVYKIAREMGLPVEGMRESQEVCFVTREGYHQFIATHVPESVKPGKFVDTTGKVLGTHKGIAFYTVGQRRGLGISAGKRLYVLRIDVDRNEIVLGSEEELYSRGLIAEDLHLIHGEMLKGERELYVKIRYKSEAVPATVTPLNNEKIQVVFKEPQRAITPGQAAVLYDGDVVVGGGIIEKSFNP